MNSKKDLDFLGLKLNHGQLMEIKDSAEALLLIQDRARQYHRDEYDVTRAWVSAVIGYLYKMAKDANHE